MLTRILAKKDSLLLLLQLFFALGSFSKEVKNENPIKTMRCSGERTFSRLRAFDIAVMCIARSAISLPGERREKLSFHCNLIRCFSSYLSSFILTTPPPARRRWREPFQLTLMWRERPTTLSENTPYLGESTPPPSDIESQVLPGKSP